MKPKVIHFSSLSSQQQNLFYQLFIKNNYVFEYNSANKNYVATIRQETNQSRFSVNSSMQSDKSVLSRHDLHTVRPDTLNSMNSSNIMEEKLPRPPKPQTPAKPEQKTPKRPEVWSSMFDNSVTEPEVHVQVQKSGFDERTSKQKLID